MVGWSRNKDGKNSGWQGALGEEEYKCSCSRILACENHWFSLAVLWEKPHFLLRDQHIKRKPLPHSAHTAYLGLARGGNVQAQHKLK